MWASLRPVSAIFRVLYAVQAISTWQSELYSYGAPSNVIFTQQMQNVRPRTRFTKVVSSFIEYSVRTLASLAQDSLPSSLFVLHVSAIFCHSFTADDLGCQPRGGMCNSRVSWQILQHYLPLQELVRFSMFRQSLFRKLSKNCSSVNTVGASIYPIGPICGACPAGRNNCNPVVGLCSWQ